MVHALYKVDHVAWPRPCFCNPNIWDIVKRIRMTGVVWEGQVIVPGAVRG